MIKGPSGPIEDPLGSSFMSEKHKLSPDIRTIEDFLQEIGMSLREWYNSTKAKVTARARKVHKRACRDSVRTQFRQMDARCRQDAEKVVDAFDRVGVVDKAERAATAVKKKLKK
jgi:hypothetical protein